MTTALVPPAELADRVTSDDWAIARQRLDADAVPDPDSPNLDALRERISAFVTFGRDTRRTWPFARANMARQNEQIGLGEESTVAADHGHTALLASQEVRSWEAI